MTDNKDLQYRSHLKLYWGIWFLFVLVLIALRLFIFNASKEPFGLFVTYALSSWIPLGFISISEYTKVTGYLEKNHRETWAHVTSHKWLEGSGWYNSWRFYGFIFSKDNLNDSVVTEMKSDQKGLLLLILAIFVTMPILFIWVMTYN